MGEYKGEWKPRQIDNPDYKGAWIHPEIDNPDYNPADAEGIAKYEENCKIGFDLWQVKSGTIFDNLIITDDPAAAKKTGEDDEDADDLDADEEDDIPEDEDEEADEPEHD